MKLYVKIMASKITVKVCLNDSSKRKITKTEVDKVFKFEITRDENDRWRSIFPETNTHKCKINREIRMKAINAYLEDDSKSLFDNWKLVGQFTLADDENRECLCGHSNNVEYYIKHSSGEIVVLGSRCIEALHKKFGGGGGIISELDWNCEKCHRRKDRKTAKDPTTGKRIYQPYCKGFFCVLDRCECGAEKTDIDPKCGGAICKVEQQEEIRRMEEIRQRELREIAERAIIEAVERQARLDEQKRLDRERRLCSKCRRDKAESDEFCGGSRCTFKGCYYCKKPGRSLCKGEYCNNCKHGQRIKYNKGGRRGWLCGCPIEGDKCKPIWIDRYGIPNIRGTVHTALR